MEVRMQSKVILAETATALLRQTLADRLTVYGAEAKQRAANVREQVRLVEKAVEALRTEAAYSPRAKNAVSTAGIVLRQASLLLSRLQDRAAYTGPIRSHMSDADKAAYIREFGSEAFLHLPE
jgi:hypothetical protein